MGGRQEGLPSSSRGNHDVVAIGDMGEQPGIDQPAQLRARVRVDVPGVLGTQDHGRALQQSGRYTGCSPILHSADHRVSAYVQQTDCEGIRSRPSHGRPEQSRPIRRSNRTILVTEWSQTPENGG